MQIYKLLTIKKNLYFFILFVLSITAQSQESKDLIKIKCLKNMPKTMEEIQVQDTIYILYHKSDKKGFEQNDIDFENVEIDSYYFYNFLHFPKFLYEYDMFTKKNIRKPVALYKKKSFICKNIKRLIDINFLKKFGFEFHTQFYEKKRVTFIIDLDKKNNNKYKVVEVNNPTFVID